MQRNNGENDNHVEGYRSSWLRCAKCSEDLIPKDVVGTRQNGRMREGLHEGYEISVDNYLSPSYILRVNKVFPIRAASTTLADIINNVTGIEVEKTPDDHLLFEAVHQSRAEVLRALSNPKLTFAERRALGQNSREYERTFEILNELQRAEDRQKLFESVKFSKTALFH